MLNSRSPVVSGITSKILRALLSSANVGAQSCRAPEILLRAPYDEKVDVNSAGMLIATLAMYE